jgi:hypothetical protein
VADNQRLNASVSVKSQTLQQTPSMTLLGSYQFGF